MTFPKVRNDNTNDHHQQGTFKHLNTTFSFPSLRMKEVHLQTPLAKWPCLVDERGGSNNTKVAEFFIRYIEFMELRKEGTSRLMLKE